MSPARRLHHPHGSLSTDGLEVDLGPEEAGWTFSGLRVATVDAGGQLGVSTADFEMAVLPLAGALDVEAGGRSWRLHGRKDVFSAVTDWLYLPPETDARIASAQGCQVALPSSRASRRFPAVYVPSSEVPVEVRGAGPATRQVNNFMAPDVFDGADRLMCVEVLTPDGNWSSYPPHKHDDSPECPVNNEEIYYFQVGALAAAEPAEGFAMHRTYTGDGQIDENVIIRHGDVFCIPRGYHGPSIAAPGYPLYYLNVLAGPGGDRSMAFCDDPSHHWVRDAWEGMEPDPRCPMTPGAWGGP